MLSKRARPWQDDSLPPDRRLRSNLSDHFLSNDVSSSRAQSLFDDGELAGARHVADLAAVGQRGSLGKNLARDLKRKLLNSSNWPKPYIAQVRTWNQKSEKEEWSSVPLLLPHEIVWAMAQDQSHFI